MTVGLPGIPAGTPAIDNPGAKAKAKDAKAPWVSSSAFTSRKTAGLLALRGSPLKRAEEALNHCVNNLLPLGIYAAVGAEQLITNDKWQMANEFSSHSPTLIPLSAPPP
jgi:hypothetical protein